MARVITTYLGQPCWCDIDQVSHMTGVVVTDLVMVRAQSLLELFTEIYADALPIYVTPRDYRHLQDALVYQAAWMAPRLDVFDAMDLSSVSQDGMSATFNAQPKWIAPIAWRAIKQLSWFRTGRIRTEMDFQAASYANLQELEQAFIRDEFNPPGMWQSNGSEV